MKTDERIMTIATSETRGQAQGLVHRLLTNLLDAKIDTGETEHIMDQLDALGHPRENVETCLLSRLCFHEALGDLHNDGNWEEKRQQWVDALKGFGISEWAINSAIKVGADFRRQLHGQSREVISQAVYDEFFPLKTG